MMVTTEECHVLSLVPPMNINAAAQTKYVHLGNYANCTFIVSSGAITAATTISVAASDDDQGSDTTALDFKYSREVTGSSDVFSALAWVGNTSGVATGTQDNSTHIVEVDASQLPAGKPWLRISLSDPANNHLVGVTAILSGSRYAQAVTPSAL